MVGLLFVPCYFTLSRGASPGNGRRTDGSRPRGESEPSAQLRMVRHFSWSFTPQQWRLEFKKLVVDSLALGTSTPPGFGTATSQPGALVGDS